MVSLLQNVKITIFSAIIVITFIFTFTQTVEGNTNDLNNNHGTNFEMINSSNLTSSSSSIDQLIHSNSQPQHHSNIAGLKFQSSLDQTLNQDHETIEPMWLMKHMNTEIITAQFGLNYSNAVNISQQFIFLFNTTVTNKTSTVRILALGNGATQDHPVFFSSRQQKGIVSWSIPQNFGRSYSYYAVGHTLCPMDNERDIDKKQFIFVEVSTMSPSLSNFTLQANLVDSFDLQHNNPKTVSVVTAQPKYFEYLFPEGVDQVLLRVTSKTHTCMVVSVQDIKCPVLDLENNIDYRGKHQTMSTQSAMFLQRSDFQGVKGFYLVLLVQSNDEQCSGKISLYDIVEPSKVRHRSKTVFIKITTATSTRQYLIATLVVVGILLGFYLLAFCMGFLYTSCGFYRIVDDLTNEEKEYDEQQSFLNAQPRREGYGAVGPEGAEADSRPPKELNAVKPSLRGNSSSHANSLAETNSLNEEEIDFLPDAEHDKDVFRNKIAMYVSDLSRKKPTKLNKYYNQFLWNLVSLAIFYSLPVVQLVITYQRVLMTSGDEDLCYYNFDCANPLKTYISSFNNVFSNIGYVMLGLLFILIVRSRDILHRRALQKHGNLLSQVGIPQHYGIFYAMGFALIMEGVMSASYHVCPNYSNFQFDTSFMYIIACLCMLRIYQNRHADVCAKSHTAYFSMAIIIFIALVGVVYSTNIFWIFYALVHMFSTFLLSAQVYFLGRWNIGWSTFKRFLLFVVNDCRLCSRPISPNRFIMLVIGNIINWTFALYGAIKQPSDFASYLLAIFIGNLLLYCMFYVIMKLLSGERISTLVVFVMLISLVLWGCSLYFFFRHVTSWQETPAGSREENRHCILFDFYDSHDVWHFLSAFSLFFSFMILFLLDDDVALKPRTQIPVF